MGQLHLMHYFCLFKKIFEFKPVYCITGIYFIVPFTVLFISKGHLIKFWNYSSKCPLSTFFSLEKKRSELSFLDETVSCERKKIVTTVYQKNWRLYTFWHIFTIFKISLTSFSPITFANVWISSQYSVWLLVLTFLPQWCKISSP